MSLFLDNHITNGLVRMTLEFHENTNLRPIEAMGDFSTFEETNEQLAMIQNERAGAMAWFQNDRPRAQGQWWRAIVFCTIHFVSGNEKYRVLDSQEQGSALLDDFTVRLQLVHPAELLPGQSGDFSPDDFNSDDFNTGQ